MTRTHSIGFVLLAILLCAVVPTPGTAQTVPADWAWQNPTPTGYRLNDVYFSDLNTGTAVGANGTIIRTTDGGATWSLQASGTTKALHGVIFTDQNTGVAVGARGTVLQTVDGGAT